MLWSRVVAMLGVLAVPLALALASQTLAERPGPAPVPTSPVELSTPQPGGADRRPALATELATEPTANPGAPRVIPPVVPRRVADVNGAYDVDDMDGPEAEPDDG